MDGREVNAFDIDGIDLVELLFADLQQGAVAVRPASVVHHHIKPAKVAQGRLHHGLDLVRLRHVRLEEMGDAPCRNDAVCHALAVV